MERFIYTIEGLNIWVGRAFGWCILILTLAVAEFTGIHGSVLEFEAALAVFAVAFRAFTWIRGGPAHEGNPALHRVYKRTPQFYVSGACRRP